MCIFPTLFYYCCQEVTVVRTGTIAARWNRISSSRTTNAILGTLLLVPMTGCGLLSGGYNASGVTKFEQANYQGALEEFQKVVRNDPDNADAFYNMAATYHRLAKLRDREQDWAQAEGYYHDCLDRNRDHQDCYRGLAVLLVEKGDAEKAFTLLENWSDNSPTIAEPKIELARLYEEFGDREAAKEQLIGALATEPNNARALAALGKIREDLGEHEQALADYQRSLQMNYMQPQLQRRVAQLSSALTPPEMLTPPTQTRTVIAPTTPWR